MSKHYLVLSLVLFVVLFMGCVSFDGDDGSVSTTTTTATYPTTSITSTTVATTSTTSTVVSTTLTTTPETTSTTVSSSTTVTTTSTSTSTSTVPDVPKNTVIINKSGDYQLLITFMDDLGTRHKNVHLDCGPFGIGDLFVINGVVYKYEDYEERKNQMRVKIKDMIDYQIKTYTLDPVAGSSKIRFSTYSFEDSLSNDDELEIEPDSDPNETEVYGGTVAGVKTLFDYGDLYLGVNATGESVGVTRDVVGPSYMDDFRVGGGNLMITVIDENGVNLNGDSTGRVTDDDSDDILLKVKCSSSEYVYIDLYDRDYNSRTGSSYTESMKASWKDVTSSAIGNPSVTLDDPDDSLLILPGSGCKLKLTYGRDNQIKTVEIYRDIDLYDLIYEHQYG